MMIKNIKAALDNAKANIAQVNGTKGDPELTAIAYALIAIAEALLEQNRRAEFKAEVEEMRQERNDHPYGF